MKNRYIRKGFTLLEVLLVIAAIGILAAIVLVSINPNRQIAQVRNADRKSDINTLYKALEQYLIDTGNYPVSISDTLKEVCDTGTESIGGQTVCGNDKADLRVLVPTYIASIPKDPSGAGYSVLKNPNNGKISIFSRTSELNESISINASAWGEGGDSVYTILVNGKTYRVHEFTTVGTSNFNLIVKGNIEYLVVGGGGGGGGGASVNGGGGGGAGGLIKGSAYFNSNIYSITIGNGGLAGTSWSSFPTSGGNSSFGSLQAGGGGAGGMYQSPGLSGVNASSVGGSGGGGGRDSTSAVGGIRGLEIGDSIYTFNSIGGASIFSGWSSAGGGGGAGGVGFNGGTDSISLSGTKSQGGVGLSSDITGTIKWYAGGGAGSYQSGPNRPQGGLGGGGAGGIYTGGAGGGNAVGENGAPGTGGGGGGGHWTSNGGSGGSGIVIIRYML